MEELMLDVRGQTYHVRTAGEGKPILLLHGFTGSAEVWSDLIHATRGFCWVAPDLLGHGKTSVPQSPERYQMAEQIQDLAVLMSRLQAHEFACCGYSMGGRVALGLAAGYPERVTQLVLESSSPGLKTPTEQTARRESDNRLAETIETGGLDPFIEYWEGIPLFAPQKELSTEVQERQRFIRQSHTAMGLANSLRGIGTGMQPSYWERLDRVTMPVLLVTGERDVKFNNIARTMEQLMPRARHFVAAGAGHTVHLERPEVFKDTVIAFLKSDKVSDGSMDA